MDDAAREDIRAVARELNAELNAERGLDIEVDILAVIRSLLTRPDARKVSVGDITAELQRRHACTYERAITAKWVGGVLRRRLQIRTWKSNGTYVIPVIQRPRLERLFEKYGRADREPPTGEAA